MTTVVQQRALVTRRLWLRTQGQNMVEYALLAGFLAVVAAGSLYLAGDRIQEILRKLRDRSRGN
jgi:Flp pilus assembly pilin Flp